MSIWEIDASIVKSLEKAIDTETGEVVDESALEEWEQLQIDRDAKIEGTILYYKNLLAESKALKDEEDKLASRRGVIDREADRTKSFIQIILKGEKFKTSKASISYRKSEVVEFSGDVRDLPDECLNFKAPEVKKAELKKLLKAGTEIAGAKLIEKKNIIIG